eukprot:9626815-Lingulodinium_polyedra.AAC.1
MAKLRKLAKNTLHLCATVLGDPDTHRRCSLILALTAPLQEEHGITASQLRSTAASAHYYCQATSGLTWLPVLAECLTV